MDKLRETKVYKWLDNYWYHYKWQTLMVLLFAVFLVIATGQLVTRPKLDINVLYTGPHVFGSSEIHSVEDAFEKVMSGDYNGDGTRGVGLTDISLMTEEQIVKAKTEAVSAGGTLVVNANAMRETERKFNLEISSGDSVICLLDPYWYVEVKAASGFLPLSEALGYKPEFALDDYGVRLRDTEFGQFFTVFSELPEDTVLCIRRLSTVSIFKGMESEKKRYDWHLSMFRDVFAFTFPEGYVPQEPADIPED